MDAYTLHLLGRAVEACGNDLRVQESFGQWHAAHPDGTIPYQSGDTLADALAALLRDLGEEVPERPTDDEVAALADEWFDLGPEQMVSVYAREPLTVLALLEGDGPPS